MDFLNRKRSKLQYHFTLSDNQCQNARRGDCKLSRCVPRSVSICIFFLFNANAFVRSVCSSQNNAVCVYNGLLKESLIILLKYLTYRIENTSSSHNSRKTSTLLDIASSNLLQIPLWRRLNPPVCHNRHALQTGW